MLAIENGQTVQEVDYDDLRKRLAADGQVLEVKGDAGDDRGAGWSLKRFSGTILDDTAAKLVGNWQTSHANTPHFLSGYVHDSNSNKGMSTATFQAKREAGRYEIQIAYPPNSNRASNVPIEIKHADGVAEMTLNQRQKPTVEDAFESLGAYRFDERHPIHVSISNEGTDGYVVVDAIRLLPVTKR